MPDNRTQQRAKRGVHGWRAFFLMFGCGTTAALLVVGIVVGVVKTFVSEFTSSSADMEPAVETRKPRETMPPELLDLCELIESQSLMSASSYNRTDDDDDYTDTATENGEVDPRVVSDECSWEVTAGSASVWEFDLSYTAYIESQGEATLEEVAREEYDSRRESILDDASSPVAEGEVPTLGDGSYRVYSTSRSPEYSYSLVRIVKSGVYQIRLSDPDASSSVEEQEFQTEVLKVTPYLDRAFERQIPDQ